MIHQWKWKWAVCICILAVLVSVLHGMSHMEFWKIGAQLLGDIDGMVELITDYIHCTINKLGYGKNSNKMREVSKHYHLMTQRAQPLFALFRRDFQKLIAYYNNLESVHLVKKFLYTYFRQSAINLIDYLRRVYELY